MKVVIEIPDSEVPSKQETLSVALHFIDGHICECTYPFEELKAVPCEDCVSREEVLWLVGDYDLSMGQVVKGIHALPSVTPQPKTGDNKQPVLEKDIDIALKALKDNKKSKKVSKRHIKQLRKVWDDMFNECFSALQYVDCDSNCNEKYIRTMDRFSARFEAAMAHIEEE